MKSKLQLNQMPAESAGYESASDLKSVEDRVVALVQMPDILRAEALDHGVDIERHTALQELETGVLKLQNLFLPEVTAEAREIEVERLEGCVLQVRTYVDKEHSAAVNAEKAAKQAQALPSEAPRYA